MLKKQNRLKSNSAFRATYNNNFNIIDKNIVLNIGHKKNDINCPTRVGFVVSKKIHKRAVIRNKIKRIMRENVRLMLKEGGFPNEYQSMVFVARSQIIDKNYNEIHNIISNLLIKLANKNI